MLTTTISFYGSESPAERKRGRKGGAVAKSLPALSASLLADFAAVFHGIGSCGNLAVDADEPVNIPLALDAAVGIDGVEVVRVGDCGLRGGGLLEDSGSRLQFLEADKRRNRIGLMAVIGQHVERGVPMLILDAD